jgi:hypothetical protein
VLIPAGDGSLVITSALSMTASATAMMKRVKAGNSSSVVWRRVVPLVLLGLGTVQGCSS